MQNAENERLARALEHLAKRLADAPRSVVGLQVTAKAEPNSSGNVVGLHVVATGGKGAGNVTGMNVSVTSSGSDPAAPLVAELLDAAAAVRDNRGAKTWISGILSRVKGLSDRLIDAAAVASVEAAAGVIFT